MFRIIGWRSVSQVLCSKNNTVNFARQRAISSSSFCSSLTSHAKLATSTGRLLSAKTSLLSTCASSPSASSSPFSSSAASKATAAAPPPEHADIIVIGGGVSGCSTLYHLAKLSSAQNRAKRLLLVERHAVTAGTTWHTAGLVWHLRPNDTDQQVNAYSWQLMRGLEAETGVNTGYIQNGGLFIAFPFSTHKIIRIDGHECRALRLSFVGELGWELHIPNASSLPVYEALMRHSEEFGLVNSGYRAMDSLSIEKGYKHWHEDLRSTDTPLEAGLGFTCKLKSDVDFLGRTALLAQQKRGITKRFALFSVADHVMLNNYEAIVRNGEYAGFLRRSEFAHAIGRSIGYGYVSKPDQSKVDMAYLKSGQYEIEQMGRRYPAEFHAKSLFDPEHKRIQGFYE